MAGNANPTYPKSYFQILLALNPDGTPIEIQFPNAGAAEEERLKFYNFLKWCRRPKNLMAVTHLQGRYNEVRIGRSEHTLSFSLHTAMRFASVDDAISQQLTAQGIAVPEIPATANPNAYRALPRGEARPSQPDIAPTPLVEAHPLPMFGDTRFQEEMNAKFAELASAPTAVTTAAPKPLNTEEATWLGERRS